MAFPNSTGPLIETKSVAKDKTSNTSAYLNGADWNNARTILEATKRIYAGSYRGWVARRSLTTITAVSVHTVSYMADGYRKEVASGRVVLPLASGTYYVWVRGNATGVAGVVKTAAVEPAPYASGTRDFPLASVLVLTTTPDLRVTHIRPDWIIGWGR